VTLLIRQADLVILLPAVLVIVSVVAARLKISTSILLVLTGVGLALLPGLPSVDLVPDFMLLFILPPIVYSSAVAMSWREFRFNLRAISLLAIGCVAFTTTAAAAAAHVLLNLSWPEGFVLGAIVSPPDAVAPLALARTMRLPRRILVVLEGEGLANDATALVFYRFAVAAVGVGAFSLGHAAITFATIAIGEVLWGLVVGWAMLRARHFVHEPRLEIILSVLTPFVAYWPPQQLGGSGVLATVTAGLYVSWNGLRLISGRTRLQGVFFWDFITFSTEGMLFLVTGLQARALAGAFKTYETSQLVIATLIVSLVVIVSRFAWVYPAIYVPRLLFSSIRRNDPSPPWQWPFAVAYTGIRGIVSLAAALAIPRYLPTGEAFPHRELILFLTYAVILITLVGQGLLLPTVVRIFGLEVAGRKEYAIEKTQEFAARRAAIETALENLNHLSRDLGLSDAVVSRIRSSHVERLRHIDDESAMDSPERGELFLHCDIESQLLLVERERISDCYRSGLLVDEARRRIERDLDLREAQLANFKLRA
jgi:monovalent cation/hydrogen antiporter